MDNIPIVCRNCRTPKLIASKKLTSYIGKTIKIRCNSCHETFPIEVTPKLLNPNSIEKKQRVTEILDVQESKARLGRNVEPKLLTINKVLNEQFQFKLSQGKNVIGRSVTPTQEQNFIGLKTQDSKMSRRHCLLHVETDGGGAVYIFVEDAGSTNGTYLNGERLEPEESLAISPNCRIRIDRTELKIQI